MRMAVVILALSALLSNGAGAQPVKSATAYFVVAEQMPIRGDSYVLPLSNPADIAFARSLIARGGFKIVTALIASGADGINRDMYAPGMPEWSWHVTEFLAFTDFTIEICDGSPTIVEQDVDGWISNTGGQICFWSYAVMDEISTTGPVEKTTWGKIRQLYYR